MVLNFIILVRQYLQGLICLNFLKSLDKMEQAMCEIYKLTLLQLKIQNA